MPRCFNSINHFFTFKNFYSVELGLVPALIKDPDFKPRAFNDNREPMYIEQELMEYNDFDCPFQADTRTG